MERYLLALVAAAIIERNWKTVFDKALEVHAWAEEQSDGCSDEERQRRSAKAHTRKLSKRS